MCFQQFVFPTCQCPQNQIHNLHNFPPISHSTPLGLSQTWSPNISAGPRWSSSVWISSNPCSQVQHLVERLKAEVSESGGCSSRRLMPMVFTFTCSAIIIHMSSHTVVQSKQFNTEFVTNNLFSQKIKLKSNCQSCKYLVKTLHVLNKKVFLRCYI